jgi:hypothetical protein
MAKGAWLEKPWVVAHCEKGQTHMFDTKAEAEQWVKGQMASGQLILYPDSPYRILPAAEVRAIQAVGATIFDDFGDSNKLRD